MRVRSATVVVTTVVLPTLVSAGSVAARLEADSSIRPPAVVDPLSVARRFAPYVLLDSDEKLSPVSRDLYVLHTELWTLHDRKFRRDLRRPFDLAPTVESLPPEPLPCPKGFRECHYYLKVPHHRPREGIGGFLPLHRTVLLTKGPVVYWHFDERDQTIQYWFFYVFNYFANWHEGDWEQITLQLKPSLDEPIRAGFSSHEGGQHKSWPDIADGRGRVGDHIVVFVARGSHANYFTPYVHAVPECHKVCADYADGRGETLGPLDYSLDELGGPVYSGDYGSGNFWLKGLMRVPKKNYLINVSDPQSRATWKQPLQWLAGTRSADPSVPLPRVP